LFLLTKQLRDKLDDLNKKKTSVTKSLSSIAIEPAATSQGLTLVVGGDKLIVKLKEMIKGAKQDYVGIHSKYGLSHWMDDGLARSLVESAKRKKLRVRMIAEVDEASARTVNYLSRYVEVRQSRDVLLYFGIVDSKEMVFGPAFPLTNEEAKRMDTRELDLRTSNASFVRGMYAMFDNLWKVCPTYVPTDLK
jgi:sugar-specific transcriptional regulator TrmB